VIDLETAKVGDWVKIKTTGRVTPIVSIDDHPNALKPIQLDMATLSHGGFFSCQELDPVPNRTAPQFNPGDRVRVSDKTQVLYGKLGTVKCERYDLCEVGFADSPNTVNYFYTNQLTLIDPPTPKRVEVVTETKTVTAIKEVTLRLDDGLARLMSITIGNSLNSRLRELADELKAALTEQSNG
jgi:hypothetical protein